MKVYMNLRPSYIDFICKWDPHKMLIVGKKSPKRHISYITKTNHTKHHTYSL